MLRLKPGKGLISITLTLIIVAALILAGGPASAVIVDLQNPGSVTEGKSKNFDFTVELEDVDEYVPIDNYTVHVGTKQATFDLSGNKLYGDPGITTTAVTGTMPYGGPLPGYGYDHDTGGVNFGTTVGYGYSGANHSVTVTIQVDTSKLGLSTGSHDVYVDLNAESSSKKHTFDSGTKTLTIKSADTGGGGDGAAPGLPPSPGDGTVKKVYTRYTVVTITPGEPAEVDLPEGAPIQAVKIGTKKTVFDPTISVAEHTGKPQDVDDPRRTVKSYVSITSTISDDDLESMELEFSVPRDWLEENGLEPENIVMMHWHDDEWKDLDTEIVSEDGEIAYRASTGELSVFAIGVVEKVAATPTPTPEATPGLTETPTPTPEPDETGAPTPTDTPGLTVLTALAALMATAYLIKRRT